MATKIRKTIEEELEKKAFVRANRRQKKTRPKMKVSGRSVFRLQRIIIKKKRPTS